MWSQLNVWIMAPGSACEIDDRKHWVVYATNAHGSKFVWKAIDYSAGLKVGTNGHLEVEIPPGTYIIWAELNDQLRTHKAVVAVHAERFAVVRLLPDPIIPEYPTPTDKPHTPIDPQGECNIEITAVEASVRGEHEVPGVIVVRGAASDCDEVVVTVRRASGEGELKGSADVHDGNWEIPLKNELELRCEETVVVEATCASNPRCRARHEFSVDCHSG